MLLKESKKSSVVAKRRTCDLRSALKITNADGSGVGAVHSILRKMLLQCLLPASGTSCWALTKRTSFDGFVKVP